jgi:TctA family transporter
VLDYDFFPPCLPGQITVLGTTALPGRFQFRYKTSTRGLSASAMDQASLERDTNIANTRTGAVSPSLAVARIDSPNYLAPFFSTLFVVSSEATFTRMIRVPDTLSQATLDPKRRNNHRVLHHIDLADPQSSRRLR